MPRGCLHISLFIAGTRAAGEFDVQSMAGWLLKINLRYSEMVYIEGLPIFFQRNGQRNSGGP